MYIALMLTAEACLSMGVSPQGGGRVRVMDMVIKAFTAIGMSTFLLVNAMLAVVRGEIRPSHAPFASHKLVIQTSSFSFRPTLLQLAPAHRCRLHASSRLQSKLHHLPGQGAADTHIPDPTLCQLGGGCHGLHSCRVQRVIRTHTLI